MTIAAVPRLDRAFTRWAASLCLAMLAACSSGPEPVVQPARYVVAPAPVYPLAARRAEEQGTVTLRVQVKADNSLGFIDVKTSSGSPRLDAAAIEAVKRARFASAKTRSGQGADSVLVVPIQFKLE
ncbi:MAG: energy transducer TonB [Rhizobacter sp.]|nr:energy transducer TonB [Rhizobacter sp.]